MEVEAAKVLIIEDEQKTALFIKRGFLEEGHVVDVALDGVDGLDLAVVGAYEMIILDVNLPK